MCGTLNRRPVSACARALLFGSITFGFCNTHAAQEASGTETESPPVSEMDFVFPDLANEALVYDGERFWIRPILAFIADYTFLDQDDASFAQVGEQEDSFDVRAARMGVALRSKRDRAWEIFFAADYLERRTREDDVFQLYDLRLRIPIAAMRLDIGKQKQPFSLEMLGLSLLNPQQERIFSPFFVTRSIGMQLSGPAAEDRMTWAVGLYNDWMESNATFSDNARDYVGRLTGLALASSDDTNYLHLGLGFRRVGPDAGVIRMSGRPESNVVDRYLDTGEFNASFAGELGFEAIWSRGPVSVAAEHIVSRVNSESGGDPSFSGSYLMLSWRATGEARRYNRAIGGASGIIPDHAHGAVEFVLRYSHIDLQDAMIDGGVLDKFHFGVNWWASRQWKLGVSYGDADLDRDGFDGNTRMLLCRLQWYY